MRIILILTAWVSLDVLFVLFVFHAASKRHGKCMKCRYSVIDSGWGKCSILGTPTGCKECKYFEKWEALK